MGCSFREVKRGGKTEGILMLSKYGYIGFS
jgi:hypothetical protein